MYESSQELANSEGTKGYMHLYKSQKGYAHYMVKRIGRSLAVGYVCDRAYHANEGKCCCGKNYKCLNYKPLQVYNNKSI
jgi:hypothetical protein